MKNHKINITQSVIKRLISTIINTKDSRTIRYHKININKYSKPKIHEQSVIIRL